MLSSLYDKIVCLKIWVSWEWGNHKRGRKGRQRKGREPKKWEKIKFILSKNEVVCLAKYASLSSSGGSRVPTQSHPHAFSIRVIDPLNLHLSLLLWPTRSHLSRTSDSIWMRGLLLRVLLWACWPDTALPALRLPLALCLCLESLKPERRSGRMETDFSGLTSGRQVAVASGQCEVAHRRRSVVSYKTKLRLSVMAHAFSVSTQERTAWSTGQVPG